MIRNCSYCKVKKICKDLENCRIRHTPIRDEYNEIVAWAANNIVEPSRLDKYYLAACCPHYIYGRLLAL